MARLTRFRSARTTVLVICTVVLGGLLVGVVRQSWNTTSAAAGTVSQEASGAEMLPPVTTLLGAMVEAQSAAVRAEPVDVTSLRNALAGVAEADVIHGDTLGTHQRLGDLTNQVEAALNAKPVGPAAYATYTGLVTLTLDLIREIGDNSHLSHDPELDSFYVMDSAIIQLPTVVMVAGRASDLAVMAGGGSLTGEDAVQVAVSRFSVAQAAEAVSSSLAKSVDFTSRAELGRNIAQPLDTFKAAADSFAPPTVLHQLANTIDSGSLTADARRVFTAAIPLAHVLLIELRELLSARAADVSGQKRFTVLAAVGIGVAVLVVIWLLYLGRGSRRAEDGGDAPSGAHAKPAQPSVGSLSSARDLLDAPELVRTGRPRSTRSWGDDNAR